MALTNALIVDDSKLARISLKRQLEAKGISVKMVESGRQALEFLQSEKPEIIFMDHMMPDLDGFETMAAIKEDSSLEHIPVIMCSGKDEPGYREEAISHGAAGILAKPPVEEALDQALADAAPSVQTDAPVPVQADVSVSGVDSGLMDELRELIAGLSDKVRVLESEVSSLAAAATQSLAPVSEPVDTDALSTAIEQKLEGRLDAMKSDMASKVESLDKQLQNLPAQEVAQSDNEVLIREANESAERLVMSHMETLENSVNSKIAVLEEQFASQGQPSAGLLESDVQVLIDKAISSAMDNLPVPVMPDLPEPVLSSQAEQSVIDKAVKEAVLAAASAGAESGAAKAEALLSEHTSTDHDEPSSAESGASSVFEAQLQALQGQMVRFESSVAGMGTRIIVAMVLAVIAGIAGVVI